MDQHIVRVVFVGGGTLDGTSFALPRTQTRYEVPVDEGGVVVRYVYVRADELDPEEAVQDSEGRLRFMFVDQVKS
ncbi:hypothetical protein [Nocardioides mesophilus]|uniref:Uncharacterized protein n=1 Tax=Nocardioides mesophilus TaxID=433659 RepID=A0A7G9RD98_9ACTN|nr:hypothetical protein [Nocardioides mesophilus]QNN53573.1 hypothetical protein H9L09_03860 [Nocardioides mesophilus]